MITLLLFGGAIVLVVVVQMLRHTRRTKTNAYDRFLRSHEIDEVRMEDIRTFKLRTAASLKVDPATDQTSPQQPRPHDLRN